MAIILTAKTGKDGSQQLILGNYHPVVLKMLMMPDVEIVKPVTQRESVEETIKERSLNGRLFIALYEFHQKQSLAGNPTEFKLSMRATHKDHFKNTRMTTGTLQILRKKGLIEIVGDTNSWIVTKKGLEIGKKFVDSKREDKDPIW